MLTSESILHNTPLIRMFNVIFGTLRDNYCQIIKWTALHLQ